MAKTLSLMDGVRHRRITARPVSVGDLQRRFQPNPAMSLKALSIKMGPFDPEKDAFRFGNSDGFPLTEEQAEQIRQRYRLLTDVVVGASLQLVRDVLASLSVSVPVLGTVGLPAVVVDAVIGEVTTKLAGSLIDKIAAPIPGRFGRCGGMAFAGYDFYLLGWTVDERFGTTPPASGPVSDYIFGRLLDSLDLNAGKFLDWFVNLQLMPIVSRVANVALGTAVGSLGGPIGAAFGALLGSQVNVFHLGGPKVILDRTKNEWQQITSTLDGQAAFPIGLIYDDAVTPIDEHQVLAIDYVDQHDGTATLFIWDSNFANELQSFSLDFRGNELQAGNSDRPLKGIFLEQYSPHQPPDILRLS
jgi:hypothetical protein